MDSGELGSEQAALRLEGCTLEGAPGRVVILQRDERGVCTDFELLAGCPDLSCAGHANIGLPEGLSLPVGWAVEHMFSYACTEERERLASPAMAYTSAWGFVAFGGQRDGLPVFVQLDVSLAIPFDPAMRDLATELPLQRLQAEQIELSSECLGPGGWPTAPGSDED